MGKARSTRGASTSELERTVGYNCPLDPPEGYRSWSQYVIQCHNPPAPYKSWLEFRMFAYGVLHDVPYEELKLPYQEVRERYYIPDGHIGDKYLIEAKGRFWDRAEADKYLHIRKCLQDGQELIFIFAAPGVTFPGAVARKDGTRMTQEEWARRNGFRFMFETDPDIWDKIEELKNEAS